MTAPGPVRADGKRNGGGIIRTSWIATAAFALSAIGGLVVTGLRGPATVVAVMMFVLGSGVFLTALAIAAGRSRTVAIGIGGLFFLAGTTAPAGARRRLMGSLAAQVLVALASASARPFTSAAFAILGPVFGLGMAGLWGARYGSFRPRSDHDGEL